jgi:SpoVK/Ycf46/Vps4 family AAA+-type ATPase
VVELARLFSLTQFDVDALLICLAPELDVRYGLFYGYLHDDVTRKRPSVDLVLNMLCRSLEEKLSMRSRFEATAPLIEHRLVQLFADPAQAHPTLLARCLRVDDRVVQYLLGSDEVDARLIGFVRRQEPRVTPENLVLPEADRQRLVRLAREVKERAMVFYLHGPYGVGKQTTAEAIASAPGLRLLVVDGERVAAGEPGSAEVHTRLALREARLQRAAIFWEGFGALLNEERRALRKLLLEELEGRGEVAFLAGDNAWEPSDELRRLPFLRLELQCPGFAERERLWRLALAEVKTEGTDIGALASKFRFTGGQIGDAAATASHLAHRRRPEDPVVTMADLHEAARLQSNPRLSALARKINPHYSWDDIVLPQDRIQQLREICNCVKYRSQVYDAWGFDRKLSLGKGLNVLFAGPPGTGKTMAAEIIARELALDLYKIDLSTVVSKYIGETEKNLSKIFTEAESSNAILFFDEADALFGRRSEVRDSHDRYANIEVGYLLQRMEEYEGVVILATNLRKNMDEAFVRRLHFAVGFPFPNEPDRRRIWERIWPEATPRAQDVDLGFMARQFEIAGGSIRNIAVGAAFLAADDGGTVKMFHLLHTTRREYQKMGKVVTEGEFGLVPSSDPREAEDV